MKNELTTVPEAQENRDTPRKRWTTPYVIQGVLSRDTEGNFGLVYCEGTGWTGTASV